MTETPRTVQPVELGEPIPVSSAPKFNLKQPVGLAFPVVELLPDPPKPKAKRGTSNGNARGSAADRRRRRAWMMEAYASDVPGFVRCYRCGFLLFNLDDLPNAPVNGFRHEVLTESGIFRRAELVYPLTIDRIIPGCNGGTYRRNNIRPACGDCNSETGGGLHAAPKTRNQ